MPVCIIIIPTSAKIQRSTRTRACPRTNSGMALVTTYGLHPITMTGNTRIQPRRIRNAEKQQKISSRTSIQHFSVTRFSRKPKTIGLTLIAINQSIDRLQIAPGTLHAYEYRER
ncbi:uncharacterized protein LOC105279359 [Ooceraea biroi]|uniref:uncharacterized protein LOC105279359 n=1 Tax=Ooceraea biroi TaxID=2015173 RepID=UPI0005BA666A|nr:uncharacterized protein LOC105279359 [Ooceraea biroi]